MGGKLAERVEAFQREGYSPREAAGILGCGRTTLYQLMNCGELQSTKLLGRRVIPRTEITRLLAVKATTTEAH